MTDPYNPENPYDPEGYRHEFDAATDAQKEAVIMAALKLNHAFADGWHYGASATEAFQEICDTLIIVLGKKKQLPCLECGKLFDDCQCDYFNIGSSEKYEKQVMKMLADR